MAKRQKKQTVTQKIMAEVCEILRSYSNNVTRSNYYRILKAYILQCKKKHNIQSLTDAAKLEYVQEYADWLVDSKKLSPFSIHTYISGITSVLGRIDSRIKLASVNKPLRLCGCISRGRHISEMEENPKHEKLIRFCKCVGIRRAEMARVRGRDFRLLDDGTGEIFIYRSKGGKYQRQRVLQDVSFVKSFFDAVGPDEKVFKSSELSSRLNIHKYRAISAQNAYKIILAKLKAEPEFEEVLKREIIDYWYQFKKTPFPEKLLHGTYTVRKSVRSMAIKNNLPIHFLRIAAIWVSMQKLSHMRISVAVENYLLYTDTPANA